MRGVLLESGSVDRYLKLGQSGYPVFDSADQILAALQRHPQWRNFFAVPQRNEQGSAIDWYSPVPGSVIAWANATDQERAQASQSLKAFVQGVQDLGAQQITRGKENGASETALFGALLQEACKIPGLSNIYLVDVEGAAPPAAGVAGAASIGSLLDGQRSPSAAWSGEGRLQPVVTFWGFVDNEGDRHSRPLYFLHEQATPVQPPPVAPVVPAVASAVAAPAGEPKPVLPPPVIPPVVAPVVAAPWWRRWWLWLLLLLGALLLLWLLRGCIPVGLGGLPAVSGLPGMPSLPALNVPAVNVPVGAVGSGVGGVPAVGLNGVGAVPMPGSGAGDGAAGAGVLPALSPEAAAGQAPETAPEQAPEQAAANPALQPPQLPEAAEAAAEGAAPTPPQLPATPQAPPAKPLEIPANAANGVADFLNGQYRTRGGLMDEQTSLPLNLQYAFENGKGQVEVQRSSGVSCKGDVLATVTGGQLSINSQGAANCSDGSSYVMPTVSCKAGAASAADCAGSYANQAQEFPMQMHGN